MRSALLFPLALRSLLACALAGLLAMPAQAQVQPGALAPGLHTLQVNHAGVARQVLVHVPRLASPAQPAPLVLALHGGGGHAAFMADDERYGFRSAADREGFVVAFPNGHSRWPGGRLATWNAGECCGQARDERVDDVGFLREVVAEVARQVPVDAQRVFATGMSNGGMMSHRLACEAGDVFRAVAAVAGTIAVAQCQPQRPVSVLHIHARDDSHVLFEGGAGPDAAPRRQIMDFTSVAATLQGWQQRLGCAPSPQPVMQRPGASCEAYAGCSGGAQLQLCVTQDGGHSWPGAQQVRRGKAPASQALDATAVIWAFFQASAPR